MSSGRLPSAALTAPSPPGPLLPGASLPGPSLTRILRIIAWIFAIASVVFGALLIAPIGQQSGMLLPWWNGLALSLEFGIPIAMGVASRWCSGRAIRHFAAAVALGQLLVMATWLPAMTAPSLPADAGSAWILGATAIGTTAAGLAWRVRFVWIYLAATCVFVVIIRSVASPQPALIPYQDALYTLMFDAIFAALAIVVVRAGFALDAAADSARSEMTLEAIDRISAQENSRVDALVHDGVLATLLIAAQDDPSLRAAAGRQAEKAVDQIIRFAEAPSLATTITAREFVWRQQAIATEIDPEAQFSYELDGELEVDPDVVVTFGESLAEALRNILRHAFVDGQELNRAVHVTVGGNRIEVEILDDGRGFDPSSVEPTRLGIAISIHGRFAQLPGGSSRVVSRLGQGTRVALSWQRA